MLLIFLMRYTLKFYSKIVSVLPWHAHILWFYVWFNVILTVSPNNTHLFHMILCLIQCNFKVESHWHQNFILSVISNFYLKHVITIRNMILALIDFAGCFPKNEKKLIFLQRNIKKPYFCYYSMQNMNIW